MIQASRRFLYREGRFSLPCLVLLTFDPVIGTNAAFLEELADRVYSLKGMTPPDALLRFVATLTTDERAVLYRRRQLPLELTGGGIVYVADLWIEPALLEKGHLTKRALPCLAEPGPKGGIELLPSGIVTVGEGQGNRGIMPP